MNAPAIFEPYPRCARCGADLTDAPARVWDPDVDNWFCPGCFGDRKGGKLMDRCLNCGSDRVTLEHRDGETGVAFTGYRERIIESAYVCQECGAIEQEVDHEPEPTECLECGHDPCICDVLGAVSFDEQLRRDQPKWPA